MLDDALRAEFAAESEEHLDAIERALTHGVQDRAGIDALFRAFHSLKGMSDAVGAAGMKALAHRAEDALGAARQGKLDLAVAAPALLAAGDALRAARAALLDEARDLPAPPDVLAALAKLLTSPAPVSATPPAPAPAAGDPLKATLLSLLREMAPDIARGRAQPELAAAAREIGLHRLAALLDAPLDAAALGRLSRMQALLAEQAGEPAPPGIARDAAAACTALAAAPHDHRAARDAADAQTDPQAEAALRQWQDLAFRSGDPDAQARLHAALPAWRAALETGAWPEQATPAQQDARLPADFATSLSADATRRALAALEAGQALFRVRAQTGGAPEDEAALEFWLRGAGEVLGSIPVPGTAQLDLLLASAAPLEGLRAALKVADPDQRHVVALSPAMADIQAGPASAIVPSLRVRQDVVDNILALAAEVRAAAAAMSEALRDPAGASAVASLQGMEHRLSGALARQVGAARAQLNGLRNRVARVDARLALSMRQFDEAILELRVVPVASLFQRLPRAVRSVAEAAGKPVRLELDGEDVRIDRSLIELLADPLLHLVRNAVDHGIEPPGQRGAKPAEALLRVAAERIAGQVRITIADDGRGIDAQAVRDTAITRGLIHAGETLTEAQIHGLLLRPGFSTKQVVTELSGRGVGLDVVHDAVRRAGGHMLIASRRGQGTTFTLTLPVSAALQPVLLVEAGGHPYGLPASRVLQVLGAEEEAEGATRLTLEAALGLPPAPAGGTVLLERAAGALALQVARVTRRTELLLRPLHPELAAMPALSAVGVLGTGEPVLVLEPDGLA